MGFTTQTFIFVFFPLCFTAYYLITLLQYKGILSKLLNKKLMRVKNIKKPNNCSLSYEHYSVFLIRIIK